MILPMGMKNDSILISRLDNRLSIHLEILELVQLFALTRLPIGPSRKMLQLPVSKVAESLFRWSDSFGPDGVDHNLDKFSWDTFLREV